MTASLEPVRHRLGLNENPYGPLPSVRRALGEALTTVNRYPEFLPERLCRLIADHIGCAPTQIVVGAGATGVIMHILQAFAASADARVVMAVPIFDGFPLLTATVGGRPVRVELRPDGSQDLTAMAAVVDDRTTVVVLCDPHNPTGTRLRQNELTAFLDRIGPHVAVILDHAYLEFVEPAHRLDTRGIQAAYPNVIAVHTFSKAFGLAGLRVGYAVAESRTAARISHWQVPFGMNSLAEIGVAASYAATAELDDRIHAITAERDRLAAGLHRLGHIPPVSSANHLFLPLPDPALIQAISASFVRDGIRVKRHGDGIRITVGDAAATDAVLNSLAGLSAA
ncbi:pyridoxal phosphate-dependent aminotransferase [Nocardia tengchongensis]|uniref:pyridoxal phosphate-dependent aminotransferase n=1 Tax=Nocardia tengchongensis TaxID=2055889 RepID=UPI00368C662D